LRELVALLTSGNVVTDGLIFYENINIIHLEIFVGSIVWQRFDELIFCASVQFFSRTASMSLYHLDML
jgi:hypothetical protein